MLPRKSSKDSSSAAGDSKSEAYYLSSRDIPLDMLRIRATELASNPVERRAARRDLLLKMGARPPKAPCVNYRIFMETKKREKEAAARDYKDERFKKTVLERQSSKHELSRLKNRKSERKKKRSKRSKVSAVTKISKSLAKKIRRKT